MAASTQQQLAFEATPSVKAPRNHAREIAEDIRGFWPAYLHCVDVHEQRGDVAALEALYGKLAKILNESVANEEASDDD